MSLLILTACQQEPPKGALRIDTIPADVPLTIDGAYVGNSPAGAGQYFAIEITEGEHFISALVDVDKEKQLFFEKKIFVAPDSLQTMTFELEERLTPFGIEAKAQREAQEAEKRRLADIERKKKEEVAAERKRKYGHIDYLNKNQNVDAEYGYKIRYIVKGCGLSWLGLKPSGGIAGGIGVIDMKAGNLSIDSKNGNFWASCRDGSKCLKYRMSLNEPHNEANNQSSILIAYEGSKNYKSIISSLKRLQNECD